MKKKVLIFSDCALFGGSEYVVVNILKDKTLNERYDFYFAYRDHKIYRDQICKLFTDEEREKFIPIKLFSNKDFYHIVDSKFPHFFAYLIKIVLRAIEHTRVYDALNYFRIKRVIKQVSPDIVHGNNGGYPAADTCLVTMVASHDLGIRTVLQINNIPGTAKKYWDKRIKESTDTFIIASKYSSELIQNIRDVTQNNVITLRDNVKYVTPTKPSDIVRSELGIKDDAIVLIQVALLLEHKGQMRLLEAIKLMREQLPAFYEKVVLVLIGSGEQEQLLRTFVKENNLNDKVFILGYRNDYIDYVNMADVMVHPTRANEDMPLIILTAMSLGKPVVSCDFAGIPEEIEHLKTGILINPNSESFTEDLLEAIVIAYQNKESFGILAKDKFSAEFSESVYVNGLSSIYETLLK